MATYGYLWLPLPFGGGYTTLIFNLKHHWFHSFNGRYYYFYREINNICGWRGGGWRVCFNSLYAKTTINILKSEYPDFKMFMVVYL